MRVFSFLAPLHPGATWLKPPLLPPIICLPLFTDALPGLTPWHSPSCESGAPCDCSLTHLSGIHLSPALDRAGTEWFLPTLSLPPLRAQPRPGTKWVLIKYIQGHLVIPICLWVGGFTGVILHSLLELELSPPDPCSSSSG